MLPEVCIQNLSYGFNMLSAAPRGDYTECTMSLPGVFCVTRIGTNFVGGGAILHLQQFFLIGFNNFVIFLKSS